MLSHTEKILFLTNIKGETISPSELATVLGGRPYLYNVSARDGSLTLPHIWRGRNLRIFKQPVIDLLSGKTWTNEAKEKKICL